MIVTKRLKSGRWEATVTVHGGYTWTRSGGSEREAICFLWETLDQHMDAMKVASSEIEAVLEA